MTRLRTLAAVGAVGAPCAHPADGPPFPTHRHGYSRAVARPDSLQGTGQAKR